MLDVFVHLQGCVRVTTAPDLQIHDGYVDKKFSMCLISDHQVHDSASAALVLLMGRLATVLSQLRWSVTHRAMAPRVGRVRGALDPHLRVACALLARHPVDTPGLGRKRLTHTWRLSSSVPLSYMHSFQMIIQGPDFTFLSSNGRGLPRLPVRHDVWFASICRTLSSLC